jgi:hypothetical protein
MADDQAEVKAQESDVEQQTTGTSDESQVRDEIKVSLQ